MKDKKALISVLVLILVCAVAAVVWLTKPAEESAPAVPTAEPAVEETAAEEPAAETPAEEPAAETPAEEPAAETPAEEPAAEVPAEEPAGETPAEEPAASQQSQEPVLLVTVNGEEITTQHPDLQYWISYNLYQLSYSGYDIEDEELLADVNRYSLRNAMQLVLIRQKAAEYGMDGFSEDELAAMKQEAEAGWVSLVESYEAEFGITEASTDEEKEAARLDALTALEQEGYTAELYVAEYVEDMKSNELIARLFEKLSADITVSDEEILAHFSDLVAEDREMYEGNITTYEFYTQYYQQPSYYTPEGYRGVTHILLPVDETLMNTWKDLAARLEEQTDAAESEPTEGSADASAEPDATPAPTAEPVTQEMVDAAKQAILDSVKPTVDEIMAKLAAGASFDELIVEYGTDPGMAEESTRAVGYPVHRESFLWDPVFTEAAMKLEKVGDVSEPVLGSYGVHILYYLRDIPGGAVELTDDLKEQIRTELLSDKQNVAFSDALDQWMKEADIVYTAEGEDWRIPEEEETAGAADAEAAGSAADAEAADGAAPAAEPAAEDAPSEEASDDTKPADETKPAGETSGD